jgi:alpha-L-rhamnosidase
MKLPPTLLAAFLLSMVTSVFGAENRPSSAPLVVSHLRCEGLDAPTLVDTPAPRFSWQMESAERGARQSAYQLRIAEIRPHGEAIATPLESPRITSDVSQWVEFPSLTVKPKTRYQWQVRVWDHEQHDSGWSAPTSFETSLLGGEWLADWLSDGHTVATPTPDSDSHKKRPPPPPAAARYFRKTFDLPNQPVSARLYLSAFGLVEPWINGQKATNDLFLPGWPDYKIRNFYVAYDVTPLLHSGPNTLGLILGEGWYSSWLAGGQAGPTPKVSAWIEVTDASGQKSIVATDASWQWAEGPITANGIYPGEDFDARKEDAAWCQPAGGAWNWQPVKVEDKSPVELNARISQPVRRIEELKPISRKEVSPGVFIYDLGQNMVGWARLKVQAPAGQAIQLRFGEMLNPDGSLYTKNLRAARATANYIAKGQGLETWEPRFSFFGFRYVELSGITVPADDAITGVVVHSDLPRIGHFECSNPLLNKLYSNTLWGQKGNFLEVPTDCPQRNERLGWTGDAQVFCHTANFNLNCGAFYRQWAAALRDSFDKNGYANVAPKVFNGSGVPGWSDAGVIVPWMTYLHTGDRRMLEENFEIAQRSIDQFANANPSGLRVIKKGFGDWLAPGYPAGKAPTPLALIATAYFARSTELVAQMAEVLGKPEIAAKDRALLETIKTAFQKEFITPDGKVSSEEQTAYLLALGFDLVPTELRPQTIQHLAQAIADKDNHLSTGFLGTPLLAPVLSDSGLSELAYKVVLQDTYPGWLFSVKNGATTIWERWDSWTPDKGFNKDGMNSFNHYAYGSVVGWFYDTIGGLKLDASSPAWKHFVIAPTSGGGLKSAKASVETPYGRAASDWKIQGDRFDLAVTIPANTSATVHVPAKDSNAVTESGQPANKANGVKFLRFENGKAIYEVGSGTYQFESKAK